MDATSLNPYQVDSPRVIHRQRDRGTPILLLLAFFLLASAVFIFTYPWVNLTYQLGTAAVPSSPVYERPLAVKSISEWCVDFNPYGDERNLSAPMRDDGVGTDTVASDGVYSLPAIFSSQGLHYWRVVACDYPSIAFPDAPSWFMVSEANQELALTFDTNRDGVESGGFLPGNFMLNASDSLPPLFIYGSINNWRLGDKQTRLEKVDGDLYRLVYQIPNKGQHLAATMFEVDGNLYGYMADGRSESWNMLEFETKRKNETVVFELDARTGRSAVFAGVPFLLAWLAYDKSAVLLLPILVSVSLLIIILALKRYEVIRRPDLLVKTGCPQCQSLELVRVPRSASMRLLRLTGLDTGNYVCRQCTWKGVRLVGGNIIEVLGSRRTASNWTYLVVMLLIWGFTITMAIQIRSSLNGTSFLSTTINSAYQKTNLLSAEFSPQSVGQQWDQNDSEAALQTADKHTELPGAKDESQGLLAKLNNWIRSVVLYAIDGGDENSKDMPVEASIQIEASEEPSRFSPVQYDN